MILALFSLFAIPAFSALPPTLRGLKAGKETNYKSELGCIRYTHSSSHSNFYVRTECNDESGNAEFGPTKIVKAECNSYNHGTTGMWYYGSFAEMDYGVWYEGDEKKWWAACYCMWWMKWEKSDEILYTWAMKEAGEHMEGGGYEINDEICRSECKSANRGLFAEMGETVLQGGDYWKSFSMEPWASEGWSETFYTLDVCIDNPWSSRCSNSCTDSHTENGNAPSQEFPPALEGHWVGEDWYQNVLIADEMKNMAGCGDDRWVTKYGSTYAVSGCKDEKNSAVMTSSILDTSCKEVLGVVYGRTVEIDQGWEDWVGCYCMYWRVMPADGEKPRTVEYMWASDKSVESYENIDKCGSICPEPDSPSVYMMVGPDNLHYGGKTTYVCNAGECMDELTMECGGLTPCGDKGIVKKSDSREKAGKMMTACDCEAKCNKDENDYFSFKAPNQEGMKGQCYCHKGGSLKKSEKSKLMVGALAGN